MKIKKIFLSWWKTLSEDVQEAFTVIIFELAFIIFLCLIKLGHYTPKELLYFFFKATFEIAFYDFLVLTISFIISIFKKKKYSKVFYISWLLAFMMSFLHLPRILNIGTTQIGAFYELPQYTESYIVYMSDKPQTADERKVYKLSAEITRAEEVVYETDEGREIYGLNYHLNKLYIPGGNVLNFESDIGYDSTILTPNKETEIDDFESDNTYYITLTTIRSSENNNYKERTVSHDKPPYQTLPSLLEKH